MKYAVLFLTLALYSCSGLNSELPVVQNNPYYSDRNLVPARCSQVVDYVQSYELENWEKTIQRMRNTYTNVLKIISDKETIDFSVAFLNSLSVSENLDQQSRNLYEKKQSYLPNTESLKFFYRSEKELEALLLSFDPFIKSSKNEIKQCATEAKAYFQAQKDFFITIRGIDYRSLKLSKLPEAMPPEILRSHAKLLEQRESMASSIVLFYESFAKASTNAGKELAQEASAP